MPAPTPSQPHRSPRSPNPAWMRGTRVRSQDGLQGEVVSDVDVADETVLVRVDDGRHLVLPAELLEVAADGALIVPFDLASVTPGQAQSQSSEVIPVIEEELVVGKRDVVTGGVRVSKKISERIQTIDEPLARDRLVVERLPLHQTVQRETLPTIRQEGETVVIPLLQEEVVVEKRLVLVEEVRVTRLREEVHAPQSVSLKREEASIERIDKDGRSLGTEAGGKRSA